MKLPHNLVCIDIETTDLNSDVGSIIELGAVIVDTEFKMLKYESFSEYIQPLDSYRNPKAMAVNQITEQEMKSGLVLQEALELFEAFCGENTFLASWGAYFDIPFLRKQYEKIGRKYPFYHRTFDLKSAAIFGMARKNIPLSGGVSRFLEKQGVNFEGRAHSALDDIINSVRILQNMI